MYRPPQGQRRKATVLLVEDSRADQITVERALEDGQVNCDLLIADNGSNALKMLRGEAPYSDRERYPSPDLILLDINMPVMDGRETLKAIRKDEQLHTIPVIMLTTSNNDQDVEQSYNMGANAFVTKPVCQQDFVKAVVQMEQFWFELVTLPKHH
ncbi:MAG: hypothetical protein COA42_13125 [Alteromonadaceae bacterium]|nr:MAG: hypothetical protein COA42_13125 [Alteromonadaceae bacterium]